MRPPPIERAAHWQLAVASHFRRETGETFEGETFWEHCFSEGEIDELRGIFGEPYRRKNHRKR